jgi:hypothetical protein
MGEGSRAEGVDEGQRRVRREAELFGDRLGRVEDGQARRPPERRAELDAGLVHPKRDALRRSGFEGDSAQSDFPVRKRLILEDGLEHVAAGLGGEVECRSRLRQDRVGRELEGSGNGLR